MKKNWVIFIDSGDTLIDEGTEKRNDREVVYEAQFIEGAKQTLTTLYELGYEICLVADGLVESFENMFDKQHEVGHCFKERVISEERKVEKPNQLMFQTALERMGLTEADKPRIMMIGNNVMKDIVGANQFGITSILLNWSPRYRMTPETLEETPDYVISQPMELLTLIEKLEN